MSQPKIYVGNLSYGTTEDELRGHFSQFGQIEDVKLIIDYGTGRSKGFGFVTYASEKECEAAVEKSNGIELGGRALRVNIAREDNRSGGPRGSAGRRPGGANRSFGRDRNDRYDRGE